MRQPGTKKIDRSHVKALTYAAGVAFFIWKWTHVNIEDRKVYCSLSNNVITAPWIERLTNWLKEFVWRKRARI